MLKETPEREPEEFGQRAYQLVCLAALVIVTITLLPGPLGGWALLPMLFGALTVVTNWRSGPMIWLGILLVLLIARSRGLDPGDLLEYALGVGYYVRPRRHSSSLLGELLLVTGTLTYLIAQARLLSITRNILPLDQREQSPWWGTTPDAFRREDPDKHRRRASARATPREFFVMILLGGLCPLAAYLLWGWLATISGPSALSKTQTQVVLLVWFLVSTFVLTFAIFSYIRQSQATEEESRSYLQDQLWQQTRWEQTRINRWLVWKRLREQKRKEK